MKINNKHIAYATVALAIEIGMFFFNFIRVENYGQDKFLGYNAVLIGFLDFDLAGLFSLIFALGATLVPIAFWFFYWRNKTFDPRAMQDQKAVYVVFAIINLAVIIIEGAFISTAQQSQSVWHGGPSVGQVVLHYGLGLAMVGIHQVAAALLAFVVVEVQSSRERTRLNIRNRGA